MVLAGISHDLRTPLSRLRLALEMSGADPATAEGMSADIDEIDATIGQFLDFARGENEALAPADLDGLVDEVIEHYARLGRSVRRAGEPAAGDPLPLARLAVRRALMNLVDNALRYAGEPVEIATRREPMRAIVEVLDRGPGVPARDAERLKRPFTRLDDARSGPAGAGLGLAIVDRVARAHRGTLELAARDGGGLAARLALHVF
jgi:two-component system, OmpR family, osmolarity sensor histidine kinase EnvZ